MSVFDTLQKWQGELPPSTYLSRRAWCEVKYTPKGETEEKDISEELMKYLLSVDYTVDILPTAKAGGILKKSVS